jgi:flagellin-specific chaperone FliS
VRPEYHPPGPSESRLEGLPPEFTGLLNQELSKYLYEALARLLRAYDAQGRSPESEATKQLVASTGFDPDRLRQSVAEVLERYGNYARLLDAALLLVFLAGGDPASTSNGPLVDVKRCHIHELAEFWRISRALAAMAISGEDPDITREFITAFYALVTRYPRGITPIMPDEMGGPTPRKAFENGDLIGALKAFITRDHELTPIQILNKELKERGVIDLLKDNPILAELLGPITALLTTHMLGIIGAREALADLEPPQGTLEKTPYTDSIIEDLQKLADINQAIIALGHSLDRAKAISSRISANLDPQELKQLEEALRVLERYPSMEGKLSAAQADLQARIIAAYEAILARIQDAKTAQKHRDDIEGHLSLFKERMFHILQVLGVSFSVSDIVIQRAVAAYDKRRGEELANALLGSTPDMGKIQAKALENIIRRINPRDIERQVNDDNIPQTLKPTEIPPSSQDNTSPPSSV